MGALLLVAVTAVILAILFGITLAVRGSGTAKTCGSAVPDDEMQERVRRAVDSSTWIKSAPPPRSASAAIDSESADHEGQDRQPTYSGESSRVLLLRQFHDSSLDRRTLRYLLQQGLHNVDGDRVQLVIVSNGEFPFGEFPTMPKHVQVMERANKGLDFGAWSHALNSLGDDYVDAFDYVLMFNGTVVGPCAPSWVAREADWLRPFLAPLNDELRLMGISVNLYEGRPHVQSMVMAMSTSTLRMAQSWGFFVDPERVSTMDKGQIIHQFEVALGTQLLEHGYNFGSTLDVQKNIDYRRHKEPLYWNHIKRNYPNPLQREVWGHDRFFGRNVPLYETVFFKFNRDLDTAAEVHVALTLDGEKAPHAEEA